MKSINPKILYLSISSTAFTIKSKKKEYKKLIEL